MHVIFWATSQSWNWTDLELGELFCKRGWHLKKGLGLEDVVECCWIEKGETCDAFFVRRHWKTHRTSHKNPSHKMMPEKFHFMQCEIKMKCQTSLNNISFMMIVCLWWLVRGNNWWLLAGCWENRRTWHKDPSHKIVPVNHSEIKMSWRSEWKLNYDLFTMIHCIIVWRRQWCVVLDKREHKTSLDNNNEALFT